MAPIFGTYHITVPYFARGMAMQAQDAAPPPPPALPTGPQATLHFHVPAIPVPKELPLATSPSVPCPLGGDWCLLYRILNGHLGVFVQGKGVRAGSPTRPPRPCSVAMTVDVAVVGAAGVPSVPAGCGVRRGGRVYRGAAGAPVAESARPARATASRCLCCHLSVLHTCSDCGSRVFGRIELVHAQWPVVVTAGSRAVCQRLLSDERPPERQRQHRRLCTVPHLAVGSTSIPENACQQALVRCGVAGGRGCVLARFFLFYYFQAVILETSGRWCSGAGSPSATTTPSTHRRHCL